MELTGFLRSNILNFAAAVSCGVLSFAPAVFAQTLSVAERQAKGIVYINNSDEPPSMDTSKQVDSVSYFWLGHLYEGLMTTDKAGNAVPGTAEKMVISADAKTYTFSIRKNAKWHDGKPVTAHDFVFSFQRLVDPAYASEYSFMAQTAHLVNASEIIAKKAPVSNLGIKALNDHTLEIKLDAPVAFFPSLMTFQTFYPVRKDIVQKYGDKYSTVKESVIGNGPYKLVSWVKENSMQIEKADTYWNAKSIKIKGIHAPSIIKDNGAAYNVFATGGLDITGLDAERLKIALKDKRRTIPFMDGSVFYFAMNTNKGKIFENKKLRQAIKLALNRGEYINRIVAVPGNKPAFGLIPDYMPGSKPNSTFRKEAPLRWKDADVAGAQKLIKEYLAETKQKRVPPFSILSGDSSQAKQEVEYFQNYFKRVFQTDVKIETVPFKTRLQKMRDKQFDMVMAGWGPDYRDPLTFMDLFGARNENNVGGYRNPQYDELVDKAAKSADMAERVKLFTEAEKILMDDAPVVPYLQRARVSLMSEGLVGVERRIFGSDPDFRFASWKSSTAKK